MTSLCIMKRGSNEIFSFPRACPVVVAVVQPIAADVRYVTKLNIVIALYCSLLLGKTAKTTGRNLSTTGIFAQ